MAVDPVLGEFEKRLREAGRDYETHIRRVSIYLRWCKSNAYDPCRPASCEAFLKSRKDRENKPNTIEAYSYSIQTFLRFMCS